MRAYLTAYLEQMEALLAADKADTDYVTLLQSHLSMIGFMQHERLIHLLVTMLVALGCFLMLGVYLMTEIVMLLPLLVLLLALFVPYIRHYYFLENAVQKLYKQHDEIRCRIARAEQQPKT